jgi:hypothetical protein
MSRPRRLVAVLAAADVVEHPEHPEHPPRRRRFPPLAEATLRQPLRRAASSC